MELYGVHHGGDYHFGGLSLARMKVEPAFEMLQAIDDLPKGSVVGLEAVSPEVLEDDSENLGFSDEDIHYWQEIVDACEDAGISVAYLDSWDIHKRAAQRRIDLRGLESSLNGDFSIVPGQERTVTEILYSLEAQINYLHAVAREDFLIRKMEEIQPQLAVIGLAHADYIMLNLELARKLGIEHYYKALIDAPYLTLGSLPLWPDEREVSQYVEQSPPSESALRDRELAVRTYNAATVGRVALDKEATWIGSWEPSNRPYGLFEVFPTGQTEGIIEDRLGTAEYAGEFGDNRLEFTKKYVTTTTYDPTAVIEDIIYEAVRTTDTDFEGNWFTYNMQGKFIIRKGTHLYDPPDTDFGQQKLF